MRVLAYDAVPNTAYADFYHSLSGQDSDSLEQPAAVPNRNDRIPGP